MKAALYYRVSTEEQAPSGYPLGQQLEALREYCQANDLEVVGEFEDRSFGASLDRSGLDTVRDLVADGGVDIVLAQDADRITRDPVHRAYLDDEFIRYGTRLVALDNWGDDSHEGELLKYMKGWVSKGEILRIAERTRRGRLRKAQEGKIVGTGKAPYGFYNADDHYHIDQDRMIWTPRIFEMITDGHSIYEVAQYLRRTGAPPPGDTGGQWHRTTIRNIILSDTYLGTFWWGKEKRTTTTVSALENGERSYRKKVKREARPREEWTAIPVPDSGIPPETIARARESILENTWHPSGASNRTWELSGGIAVCGHCGSRLKTHTTSKAAMTKYFYYICPKKTANRDNDTCLNTTHYRAQHLEEQVGEALADALEV